MASTNTLPTPPFNASAFIKPALIGWGIGLAVILYFAFGVDNPSPSWGAYWRIRPLLVTPIATAAGGVFFSLMESTKLQGYKKALSIAAGVIGFLISLWMGIVLGLAGTMWN